MGTTDGSHGPQSGHASATAGAHSVPFCGIRWIGPRPTAAPPIGSSLSNTIIYGYYPPVPSGSSRTTTRPLRTTQLMFRLVIDEHPSPAGTPSQASRPLASSHTLQASTLHTADAAACQVFGVPHDQDFDTPQQAYYVLFHSPETAWFEAAVPVRMARTWKAQSAVDPSLAALPAGTHLYLRMRPANVAQAHLDVFGFTWHLVVGSGSTPFSSVKVLFQGSNPALHLQGLTPSQLQWRDPPSSGPQLPSFILLDETWQQRYASFFSPAELGMQAVLDVVGDHVAEDRLWTPHEDDRTPGRVVAKPAEREWMHYPADRPDEGHFPHLASAVDALHTLAARASDAQAMQQQMELKQRAGIVVDYFWSRLDQLPGQHHYRPEHCWDPTASQPNDVAWLGPTGSYYVAPRSILTLRDEEVRVEDARRDFRSADGYLQNIANAVQTLRNRLDAGFRTEIRTFIGGGVDQATWAGGFLADALSTLRQTCHDEDFVDHMARQLAGDETSGDWAAVHTALVGVSGDWGPVIDHFNQLESAHPSTTGPTAPEEEPADRAEILSLGAETVAFICELSTQLYMAHLRDEAGSHFAEATSAAVTAATQKAQLNQLIDNVFGSHTLSGQSMRQWLLREDPPNPPGTFESVIVIDGDTGDTHHGFLTRNGAGEETFTEMSVSDHVRAEFAHDLEHEQHALHHELGEAEESGERAGSAFELMAAALDIWSGAASIYTWARRVRATPEERADAAAGVFSLAHGVMQAIQSAGVLRGAIQAQLAARAARAAAASAAPTGAAAAAPSATPSTPPPPPSSAPAAPAPAPTAAEIAADDAAAGAAFDSEIAASRAGVLQRLYGAATASGGFDAVMNTFGFAAALFTLGSSLVKLYYAYQDNDSPAEMEASTGLAAGVVGLVGAGATLVGATAVASACTGIGIVVGLVGLEATYYFSVWRNDYYGAPMLAMEAYKRRLVQCTDYAHERKLFLTQVSVTVRSDQIVVQARTPTVLVNAQDAQRLGEHVQVKAMLRLATIYPQPAEEEPQGAEEEQPGPKRFPLCQGLGTEQQLLFTMQPSTAQPGTWEATIDGPLRLIDMETSGHEAVRCDGAGNCYRVPLSLYQRAQGYVSGSAGASSSGRRPLPVVAEVFVSDDQHPTLDPIFVLIGDDAVSTRVGQSPSLNVSEMFFMVDEAAARTLDTGPESETAGIAFHRTEAAAGGNVVHVDLRPEHATEAHAPAHRDGDGEVHAPPGAHDLS